MPRLLAVLAIAVLLVIWGGSPDAAQSNTAQQLNGVWRMDGGAVVVFDLDADRVLIDERDAGLQLAGVKGNTLYFKGARPVQVRLAGENAAEFHIVGRDPFPLTRIQGAPPP